MATRVRRYSISSLDEAKRMKSTDSQQQDSRQVQANVCLSVSINDRKRRSSPSRNEEESFPKRRALMVGKSSVESLKGASSNGEDLMHLPIGKFNTIKHLQHTEASQ